MNKTAAALALTAGMLIVAGGFVISHLIDSAVPVSAASESPNATTETVADIPKEVTDQDEQDYIVVDENIEASELSLIPTNHDDDAVIFEEQAAIETIKSDDDPIIFNDSIGLLESVYKEMGNIMWPTYLPEGFAIESVFFLNPMNSSSWPGDDYYTDSCYYKQLNKLHVSFSNGENEIRFWVNHFQSYVPSSDPYSTELVPFEKPPLMKDEKLIYINGYMAAVRTPDPPQRVSLWDTENGLEDHFDCQHITGVPFGCTEYHFGADEKSDVAEDEFIKMAKSLEHIKNLVNPLEVLQ
jgi:hypothetical protein